MHSHRPCVQLNITDRTDPSEMTGIIKREMTVYTASPAPKLSISCETACAYLNQC